MWCLILCCYIQDQNVSHRDVWNSKLSVDDKRKLIVQAVKKGYTIAMECLKVCLKKYEKRRQIFEVTTL